MGERDAHQTRSRVTRVHGPRQRDQPPRLRALGELAHARARPRRDPLAAAPPAAPWADPRASERRAARAPRRRRSSPPLPGPDNFEFRLRAPATRPGCSTNCRTMRTSSTICTRCWVTRSGTTRTTSVVAPRRCLLPDADWDQGIHLHPLGVFLRASMQSTRSTLSAFDPSCHASYPDHSGCLPTPLVMPLVTPSWRWPATGCRRRSFSRGSSGKRGSSARPRARGRTPSWCGGLCCLSSAGACTDARGPRAR